MGQILQNPKGADYLITVLENIKDLTFILIFISSIIYRRQLKLTKWKRKLSKGEMTMYIITTIALPIYGLLILFFYWGHKMRYFIQLYNSLLFSLLTKSSTGAFDVH